MPLVRLVLTSLLVFPALVEAQETAPDAPFYEVKKANSEEPSANFQGSITSSTFFFTESGKTNADTVPLESASGVDRIFTDLRLQLRADSLASGKVDVKFDMRGRKQIDRCKTRVGNGTDRISTCEAAQAGTFGGDELDLREAVVRYRAGTYDVMLGRQFIPEVAAIKFDGVRADFQKGKTWKYSGFAGLYPTRGSRDVREDYAKPTPDAKRVMPIVAGGGASYRRESVYGSIGLAGILPRADNLSDGKAEKTRLLLTSTGYWQQSRKTDIYHNAVLDVAGSNGFALTNISVGVDHRPISAATLFARLNRVDTETLNVHAQQRLDTVDPQASAPIQNNWYVARVAQESGELGASAAFKQNRFSLSASGTLRRRPELTLLQTDKMTNVKVPLAQALDIQLRLVDRKSYKGFRVSGSLIRSTGVGDKSLDRSKATLASLELSRDLSGGKGEFEVDLSYLGSTDDNRSRTCGTMNDPFADCFGTSESRTLGIGGLLFYRPKQAWFVMAMVNISRQSLGTAEKSQPAVLMLTTFARLAYRF